MVPWSGTGTVTGGIGGTELTGLNGTTMLLHATSKRATLADLGGPGFPADNATRAQTDVFWVGTKEKIDVQTNTSLPWTWRRIVFSAKGIEPISFTADSETTVAQDHLLTSNGYVRYTARLGGDSENAALAATVASFIFKGSGGIDWLTPINAPISRERVQIWYDKTVNIRSGNDVGTRRVYNRWHPIRKTMIYQDRETGGREDSRDSSSLSRASVGDVYIVDIIQPHGAATDSDSITFAPNATVYWHER